MSYSQKWQQGMLRQLPNSLSLFRIIISFLFPWIEPGMARGLFLFVLGVTDFLDGFLARKFQVQSTLGTILDPIGDKLIILIASVTFLIEESITPFELSMIFTRDYALLLFFLWMKLSDRWEHWKIQSFWIGKIMTFLQFFLFFLISFGFKFSFIMYVGIGVFGFLSLIELLWRSWKSTTE